MHAGVVLTTFFLIFYAGIFEAFSFLAAAYRIK